MKPNKKNNGKISLIEMNKSVTHSDTHTHTHTKKNKRVQRREIGLHKREKWVAAN